MSLYYIIYYIILYVYLFIIIPLLNQAVYWPPGSTTNFESYETDYDTSNIHSQKFYIPNLNADREYVLTVQVKTTGGRPSPGSEAVQFKTTEGSMYIYKSSFHFFFIVKSNHILHSFNNLL